MSRTSVSDEGLAKLAPLESLEQLAINEDVATAAGFDALVPLKRLKAVHILAGKLSGDTNAAKSMRRAEFVVPDPANSEVLRPATLALDDGQKLAVLSFELDGLRRALRALRRSHPGIVVDAAYPEFARKNDLEPPWSTSSIIDSYLRRLLYER